MGGKLWDIKGEEKVKEKGKKEKKGGVNITPAGIDKRRVKRRGRHTLDVETRSTTQ